MILMDPVAFRRKRACSDELLQQASVYLRNQQHFPYHFSRKKKTPASATLQTSHTNGCVNIQHNWNTFHFCERAGTLKYILFLDYLKSTLRVFIRKLTAQIMRTHCICTVTVLLKQGLCRRWLFFMAWLQVDLTAIKPCWMSDWWVLFLDRDGKL